MHSRQVATNMPAVHHLVEGQGAPALLVHGHASSSRMWQRLIADVLKSRYRCHAVDLPGHGDSGKPDLAWYTLENFTATLNQFCRNLGLDRILLIGHSLGGLISLNLALEHPYLVKQLILIAPAVKGDFLTYLDPLRHLEGLISRPVAVYLLGFYQRFPLLAAPGALNTYAHPRMLFSDSFREGRVSMAQCTSQSLYGSYKVIRQADLSGHLPYLRPPSLVITGAKDRVVPPAQSELVAILAPRAKLVSIPGAGHLPLDEQPGLFDAAVQEFLLMTADADGDQHRKAAQT